MLLGVWKEELCNTMPFHVVDSNLNIRKSESGCEHGEKIDGMEREREEERERGERKEEREGVRERRRERRREKERGRGKERESVCVY